MSEEGCGVSRRSAWLRSTLMHAKPLMSHTATGMHDVKKQLFFSSLLFSLPLRYSISRISSGIRLRGARQDKQAKKKKKTQIAGHF